MTLKELWITAGEVVEATPEFDARFIFNRESIDWSPSDVPAGENGP
jgi:hypothetical protein